MAAAKNAALKVAPIPKREIALRKATARDTTALYNLLIRYFDELKLFYPSPVENPTIAWGLTVVMQGVCILAESEGQLIGSVGLDIGNFPWSPQSKYFNGVWFYVAPAFRKGGTGERLIKTAKEIADTSKLSVRLDNIWGVEPELQDRWRAMHGFQYVGGNHVYFPKQG